MSSVYNYIPNNWDGNNGASINTTSLQKIESGVKFSHERVNNVEDEISQNTTNIIDTTNNIITIDGNIYTLQSFMNKFNLSGVNGQVLTLKDGNIILQSPTSGGTTSIGNITQWESSKLYTGNVSTVIYNNGSFYGFYLCKITTANILFTPTDWDLIGETGFIGAETTDILKNKTIDAIQNTVQNIGLTNLASGIIEIDNTLGSNSDLKIATVKAIREFVENKLSGIVGGMTRKGIIDASLGLLPSNVTEGWYYIVSTPGNVGVYLYSGDYIIANKTVVGSTNMSDWNVIPNTLTSDILRETDISTNADFTIDTGKLTDRGAIKIFVDGLTTTKVNVSDIIDDLIHADTNKPLSANQGKTLKDLLGSLSIIVSGKAIQSDLIATNANVAENTSVIVLKAEINDIGTTGDTTETYSVDKILTLLSNKQNKIFIQTTQPAMLTDNIWIDTTLIPYKISRCDGVVYNQIGGTGTGGGTLLTDWVTNTVYTVNTSFVIYSNAIYRCISSHTSVTWDALKWQPISGSYNDLSNKPTMYSPKGIWSNLTAYVTNDSVTLNGSTFYALYNNTNQQPSTANPPVNTVYWAVLASKGATGIQGIPGISGAGAKTVVFCLTGVLTTGVNKIGWLSDGTYTITKIKIYSSIMPTGADIIVDIHKNGVSLFTTQVNRPTVIVGTNLGTDRTNMDITTVVENDYVSLDIDQVGSTIAGGNNLIVELVIV